MEAILQIIVPLVLSIGLFALFRKAVLWYFRIDKRIELQKDTIRLLIKIVDNTSELELTNKL